MEIKTIVFDLGGVIIDVQEQRTLDAFRQLGFYNIEEIYTELLNDGTLNLLDTGKLQPAELFHRLNTFSLEPISPDALTQAWNAMLLDIPEERINLLRILSTEYKLVVLSNTNSVHIYHIEDMLGETYDLSLNQLFEASYYSYQIGLRKPDLAVFEHLLQAEGVLPDEILLLDDKPENITSARKLGFQTQWITENNALLSLFTQ